MACYAEDARYFHIPDGDVFVCGFFIDSTNQTPMILTVLRNTIEQDEFGEIGNGTKGIEIDVNFDFFLRKRLKITIDKFSSTNVGFLPHMFPVEALLKHFYIN